MNVTGKSTSTYSLVLHFSLCTGLTECNPSRALHVKFHTAQVDASLLFFLLLQGGPALFVTSSHTLASLQSEAAFCQFHHFKWKYGVNYIRDQSVYSGCVGNSLPFGKSTKTSAFIKAVLKLSGPTETFCDPQNTIQATGVLLDTQLVLLPN